MAKRTAKRKTPIKRVKRRVYAAKVQKRRRSNKPTYNGVPDIAAIAGIGYGVYSIATGGSKTTGAAAIAGGVVAKYGLEAISKYTRIGRKSHKVGKIKVRVL
jgi:F0F1-type ATP synthase alpha subunit